jgi:hypothetical protein
MQGKRCQWGWGGGGDPGGGGGGRSYRGQSRVALARGDAQQLSCISRVQAGTEAPCRAEVHSAYVVPSVVGFRMKAMYARDLAGT